MKKEIYQKRRNDEKTKTQQRGIHCYEDDKEVARKMETYRTRRWTSIKEDEQT